MDANNKPINGVENAKDVFTLTIEFERQYVGELLIQFAEAKFWQPYTVDWKESEHSFLLTRLAVDQQKPVHGQVLQLLAEPSNGNTKITARCSLPPSLYPQVWEFLDLLEQYLKDREVGAEAAKKAKDEAERKRVDAEIASGEHDILGERPVYQHGTGTRKSAHDQTDISYRRKIVRKANEIYRTRKPRPKWVAIADELEVPERTLRDWRHNPVYQ